MVKFTRTLSNAVSRWRFESVLGGNVVRAGRISIPQIKARQELLTAALRPNPQGFSIDDEYPLVLAQDETEHSFGVMVDRGNTSELLIAHANLLPRLIFSPKGSIKVGFVGNVATRPDFRGRGAMRYLFNFLEEKALENALAALVLWSEQIEFYHRLGFESFGVECHYFFDLKGLAEVAEAETIYRLEAREIRDDLLQEMLEMRGDWFSCCDRSIDEFRTLLKIPDTFCFLNRNSHGQQLSYVVVGKGADMRGVIHEWAAPSAASLLGVIKKLLAISQADQLVLLAPGQPGKWLAEFNRYCTSRITQPVGLAKALVHPTDVLPVLNSSTIWGLDSI